MTGVSFSLTSGNTQLWGANRLWGYTAPLPRVDTANDTAPTRRAQLSACPTPPCNQLQLAPTGSDAVARYVDAGVATNTRRAYQQDLDDFRRWGGAVPSSSRNVAAYLADRAQTQAPATLARRLVGIGRAHVTQGLPDPTKDELVRRVLRGIQRVKGCAQRQAAPLLTEDINAMVGQMHGLVGRRDRALILLGFAAALRRSELAALQVRDIEFVPQGLLVHVRKSKTDQAALGRRVAVAVGRANTCPVHAVKTWLEAGAITCGPVFRPISRHGHVGQGALTGQSVALIVKGYASLAGLDATKFSGHSLRAGLVTSAVQADVAVHKIQQQTGHRSLDMLARYIRDSNVFEGNASGAVL